MSRANRLIEDFKACQGPFPYRELVRLLSSLGYEEKTTGGGSARKFVHTETKRIIKLHEPHPGNEVKAYMVKQVRERLIEQGLI